MSTSTSGRHHLGRVGAALRRPVKALTRPAVATSVGIAVVASTAAGFSTAAGQPEAALSLTTAQSKQADAFATAQAEQGSELAARKSAGNQQRSAQLEQARRAAVAKAKAVAAEKARVAAAKKAEAQAARQAAVARKAAAADEARAAAAAKAQAAEQQAAERQRAQAAERVSRSQQRQAITTQTTSDPRGAARAMLAQYGWSSGEFGCLDSLWSKESSWDLHAQNGSSGAYGIPQALPGSKMASAGSDWRTNPVTQVKWGLDYIRSVYGTPCAAWSHSQSVNWY